jgi:hypothetical protein
MLCKPTNVAAASCHALFPVSSHCGEGTSAMNDPHFFFERSPDPCTSRTDQHGKTQGMYHPSKVCFGVDWYEFSRMAKPSMINPND